MSLKPFNYSSSVFIGKTTPGYANPVFFDPHTSVFNNKPPCTLITGGPGSGKTFLGLTLASISAILGKTTIILDPKGDFLALKSLEDEIGKLNVWDIRSGRKGMLDPFYMAEKPADKLSLAIEVIGLFVGGLDSNALTVLSPILQDVIAAPNPSLQKVVDELRGSLSEEGRGLGARLDLVSKLEHARLCFAPGNRSREAVDFSSGITAITLLGLELPGADSAPSFQGQLASGIMFLLTNFLRNVMMNDQSDNPKTIIIDEAHEILSSSAGQSVIKKMALLGRSKKLALIMISQNVSHFANLDISNTISTRFAFKSAKDDAKRIVEAMDLPIDAGFESVIIQLEPGECLMSDSAMKNPRYSKVSIVAWNKRWKKAFETNPLVLFRMKKAAEAKAAAALKASNNKAAKNKLTQTSTVN